MIVYDKLWEVMKERGVSQYTLLKNRQISGSQLDRLRTNGDVSTGTLDRLCSALQCRLGDIAEYRED